MVKDRSWALAWALDLKIDLEGRESHARHRYSISGVSVIEVEAFRTDFEAGLPAEGTTFRTYEQPETDPLSSANDMAKAELSVEAVLPIFSQVVASLAQY